MSELLVILELDSSASAGNDLGNLVVARELLVKDLEAKIVALVISFMRQNLYCDDRITLL